MSSNDRVLLDSIVKDKHAQIASDIPEDDFFELFIAEQLLWEHSLSWEEIQSGLTGGGDDGGMDAIYIFCNGRLLDSDMDLSVPVKNSAAFELIIIQAKRSASFTETAIEKLNSSLLRLLDLDKDLNELRSFYNSEVIAWFDRFRSYYLRNASTFPSVNMRIYYGSRGFDIHPKVMKKVSELEIDMASLFSESTCEFSFVTPSELVALARRQRPTTLDLHLDETIATTTGGFVGLASISDYFEFICADNGDLRNAIFESNVRDYEGAGGINASIRKTLEEDSGEDFWWLNNGVTIVASRAAQYGKTLTLEYPQVVNGLQTSREIYEYLTAARKDAGKSVGDRRTVLIRIVVPPNDDSRDRIIRATNSQTAIPSVALRATDKIQRDLEDYFLRQGWYYERRKNRYQNENKPISRIITIPFLAESVLAIILREPHLGGPRLGGRFLKNEDVYERIFDSSVPLVSYFKSAQITRIVELRLRQEQVKVEWSKYRARKQRKGEGETQPEEGSEQPPARRRRRRSRGKAALYRPHRYLLPVATAVALSRSNDRYIVDLAELDPESISSEEVARWTTRIANLDPNAQFKMKAEEAEKTLSERLLASLYEKK